MKDPAVLFYFQDFLVGTEFMTDEEVGKYIRILCHQADKGSLTYLQLQRICKQEIVPEVIMEKLTKDESGKFYQKRMQYEKEKRVKYSESRRRNLKKEEHICDTYETHMNLHMENENENIDVNDKKVFNEMKKLFLQEFEFRTGQPYYFSAKDAKNLKQLQRKVENLLRNKGHTVDFDNVVNSFMLVISNKKNKWLNENFSIPILNSKFNEQIAGLTTTGTSDREFAEVLAKHLGH